MSRHSGSWSPVLVAGIPMRWTPTQTPAVFECLGRHGARHCGRSAASIPGALGRSHCAASRATVGRGLTSILTRRSESPHAASIFPPLLDGFQPLLEFRPVRLPPLLVGYPILDEGRPLSRLSVSGPPGGVK